MMHHRALALLLLCSAVLCSSAGAAEPNVAAGRRIVPVWKPGQEPTYEPASLDHRTNAYRQAPLVFRTVWDVPHESGGTAVVRVRAAGWVYVWVNGQCVYDVGRRGEEPAVAFPVDVVLHLPQGKSIVCVSSPKDGFSLAGWLWPGKDSPAEGKAIASEPGDWRAWKFAPLTILRDQPLVRAADLPKTARVTMCQAASEGGVRISRQQAKEVHDRDRDRALADFVEDTLHQCRLLRKRGVSVAFGRASGWGGPGNIPSAVLALARRSERECIEAVERREAAKAPETPAKRPPVRLAAGAPLALARFLLFQQRWSANVRLLSRHLKVARATAAKTDRLWRAAAAHASGDERASRQKAWDLLSECGETVPLAMGELYRRWGAPLNELDSSVGNKAGWIDDPTLMGSVPAAWGVRVNPVAVSWTMDLAGKWRFKLDPKNTGLEDRVHEFGYNIANQWPEVTVPGTWEKQGDRFQVENRKAIEQSPYPGVNVRTDGPYNGFAWYRRKVLVPEQWAGYDLELYMGAVDDWDWAYFNGEQIGHVGAKSNPDDWWKCERHYRIPAEKVAFGGYNVIAVRVYDCGAGGGILGGAELRCPALKAEYETKQRRADRKRTEVFSSPHSPAAMLTVGGGTLDMFGWDLRSSAGPDGVLLPSADGATYRAFAPAPKEGTKVEQVLPADLPANWLLLWAKPGRGDGELPIQLVFVDRPKAVRVERGQTGTRRVRVEFAEPGARVLALRPIRTAADAAEPADGKVLKACRFWSRAALAYPTHYAELARLTPGRKDRLEVTDIYDYRVLKDAWGNEPLKLAPLPPLACYGLKVGARDLTTAAKPLPLSLGEYGRYHAAVDACSVHYTVPVDTLPRLGGFTSFCFGSDVGVPGNHKELDIIARTGCNSWRPQSNDAGERIVKTVRWCNDRGLNCMLNIDNTLGAKPAGVAHWAKLTKAFAGKKRWQVAFDLINEPATMRPGPYNEQIRRMVAAVREADPDKSIMLYIETPHSYASIDQFTNLAPVDDPAVVYTFHDYDYRLPERWPTLEADIRNMQRQWLPAMKYSLKHDAPICISEYGGFEQTAFSPFTNRSTLTLLADFFKVFDQFGWHHHYYSNRGIVQVRLDGSIRLSLVHEAFRRHLAGDRFYRYRDDWKAVTGRE